MKKISLLVLGSVFFMGASITAFAEIVQAPVQSVDASKNEIVVKDNQSGAGRTVIVHPKIISTLHKGSVVKVSLKPGTNTADTLEVNIG